MKDTIRYIAHCAMNGSIVYCIAKAAVDLKKPVIMLLIPLSTYGYSHGESKKPIVDITLEKDEESKTNES